MRGSHPPRRTSGHGPFASVRWLARLGALLAAVAVTLIGGAGVAAAHVTVRTDDATTGSYAKLTFRVPNESATASTTGLTVSLPTDHPLPSVAVMQQPGWSATMTTVTLAPPVTAGHLTVDEATDSVTWTVQDGAGIGPGEFAEFALSVGPMPDVDTLSFPAVQTYSDGSTVAWDDTATGRGDEPEHPAPTLTVTQRDTAQAASADAAPASTAAGSSEATGLILSVAALILASAALLVAVIGIRRRAAAAAAPDPNTTQE